MNILRKVRNVAAAATMALGMHTAGCASLHDFAAFNRGSDAEDAHQGRLNEIAIKKGLYAACEAGVAGTAPMPAECCTTHVEILPNGVKRYSYQGVLPGACAGKMQMPPAQNR